MNRAKEKRIVLEKIGAGKVLRNIAVKKLKCFWRRCENSGEKVGEGTAVKIQDKPKRARPYGTKYNV